MPKEIGVNHYEVLQVSPSAEPEMIHRVYRMLAQRYHPDNSETGDEGRFRTITDAYAVLSDPEKRARYDVAHLQRREGNMGLMSAAARAVLCQLPVKSPWLYPIEAIRCMASARSWNRHAL